MKYVFKIFDNITTFYLHTSFNQNFTQSIHSIKHLHFIYMNDMNNILMESGADFDCI